MAKFISSKNNWWKSFATVLLAFMLSFILFISAACGKKTEEKDDDSPTETVTDEQMILNGNFEFPTTSKVFPVTSLNNWNRTFSSTTGNNSSNPSSNYSSGIIDVTKIDEFEFSGSSKENELKEIKAANPGTHFKNEDERKAAKEGNRILMLANKYFSNSLYGTALKTTSTTTLTIEAGTALKINVWLKTQGFINENDPTDKTLKNCWGEKVNGKAGAYIGLENTVGSSSIAPYSIKNIETNGEWQKYTLLVEASDYSSAQVKLVLGLGYGDSLYAGERVEGYAFFDDISCEIIPITAEANAGENKEKPYDDASYSKYPESTIFKTEDNKKSVRDSSDRIFIDNSEITDVITANGLTDKIAKLSFAYGNLEANAFGDQNFPFDFDYTKDDSNIIPPTNSSTDTGIQAVSYFDNKPEYKDFIEKYPFDKTGKILFLRAKNPTSLTATLANDITVKADEFVRVSFWVKTNEIKNGAGARIQIIDKGNGLIDEKEFITSNSFDNIDTTAIKKENDYYDGWTKYSFYIENGSDIKADRKFSIKLTFGLTTLTTDQDAYNAGYAAFTNFVVDNKMEKDIFNSASASGSYAKKVTLNAGFTTSQSTAIDAISAGDKYIYDEQTSEKIEKITKQVVLPANYLGIGDNTKTTSGLIDYQYLNNYGLGLSGDLGAKMPLIIKNNSANTYGYISKSSKSIAANSYTEITFRVKVDSSAKAYIYLTEATEPQNKKALSFVRPTGKNGDKTYTEETKEFIYEISNTNGKWVEVSYYIVTGSQSKNYKVEFWNGSKDGATKTTGLVMFDGFQSKSFDKETYELALKKYGNKTGETAKFDELKYLQQTTYKVPTKEENDGVEPIIKDYIDETLAKDYKEITVYLNNNEANKIFANYSIIDLSEKPKDVPEEDVPEEDKPTTDKKKSNTNVWLMISSLILAIVLIITLVAVLVKRINKKRSKDARLGRIGYSGKKVHFDDDTKKLNSKNDDATDDTTDEIDDDEEEFDYDNINGEKDESKDLDEDDEEDSNNEDK